MGWGLLVKHDNFSRRLFNIIHVLKELAELESSRQLTITQSLHGVKAAQGKGERRESGSLVYIRWLF